MSEHLDSSPRAMLERIAEKQTNESTKSFLNWMASKGIRKWKEEKKEEKKEEEN